MGAEEGGRGGTLRSSSSELELLYYSLAEKKVFWGSPLLIIKREPTKGGRSGPIPSTSHRAMTAATFYVDDDWSKPCLPSQPRSEPDQEQTSEPAQVSEPPKKKKRTTAARSAHPKAPAASASSPAVLSSAVETRMLPLMNTNQIFREILETEKDRVDKLIDCLQTESKDNRQHQINLLSAVLSSVSAQVAGAPAAVHGVLQKMEHCTTDSSKSKGEELMLLMDLAVLECLDEQGKVKYCDELIENLMQTMNTHNCSNLATLEVMNSFWQAKRENASAGYPHERNQERDEGP